jgi:F0F1-type ATP synthase membrane subunit b/b'
MAATHGPGLQRGGEDVAGAQRRERRGRATAIGLLLASLLVAGEAFAAEGNLVLVPSLKMLGALLLLFVLLIFPVHALLLRPIFTVLDAREAKIIGTRTRAEKIAADADDVLARYERAVREVREEAEQDRKARLAATREESTAHTHEARSEAEREMESAREQIAQALAEARGGLRSQADALAREAAARVLGRTLS